jgi:hypothetical protein
VEREYLGEPCVFFGHIGNPSKLSLQEIHTRIRHFAEAPIGEVKSFRKMLSVSIWPRFLRRALLWLGLNLPRTRPRTRPGQFGTFGLSVYSSLGAESLHPLSPLTTTLNYGVINPDGTVWVRMIYDHRVFDGATAARALAKLDEVINGPILAELQLMTEDVEISRRSDDNSRGSSLEPGDTDRKMKSAVTPTPRAA